MIRVNITKGLGPTIQLAEGWTVDLDPDVHHTLDQRTDKGWPTTWFAPRLNNTHACKTVYDVMNNWGANHAAIAPGHIGQDLITTAAILRIPVAMHNVDDYHIFRPNAWNNFGMDKENADYRACQCYGALYG
jgi:L-fucose isomerase